MLMETGLQMIALKRRLKILCMSPKPVAILTIFSKELAVLVESCIANILESRNLNRKKQYNLTTIYF